MSALRLIDVLRTARHIHASIQISILVLKLITVHRHLTDTLKVALGASVSFADTGRTLCWHFCYVSGMKCAGAWPLSEDVRLLSVTIIRIITSIPKMFFLIFDLYR